MREVLIFQSFLDFEIQGKGMGTVQSGKCRSYREWKREHVGPSWEVDGASQRKYEKT